MGEVRDGGKEEHVVSGKGGENLLLLQKRMRDVASRCPVPLGLRHHESLRNGLAQTSGGGNGRETSRNRILKWRN